MRITKAHVTMGKQEFVNEHTRLVNVLQGRQLSKLRKEAREQSEELRKVKKVKAKKPENA